MKLGRSLQELAAEVERQRESRRDYVASTENITMTTPVENEVAPFGALGKTNLLIGDTVNVGVRPVAHGQIAAYANIPKGYYDRMLANDPKLLTQNVNAWLHRNPQKRMVRTLDGDGRAFLSSGFRPLDNAELLETALPRIIDLGVEVISCEVTERRLYVKVVDKRIMRDLPTGVSLGQGHHRFDTVSPAMVISNSEVGDGALAVLTSVWTGGCSNLMVISERSTRKYHVGQRVDIGDEVYAMLSDETRRVTDEALWRQLGDVITAGFDIARFDATVEKIAATAQNRIEADPVKVVEVTAKRMGFTDAERGSVLKHLIQGGDLTQYGLHAAVTRAAEDIEDYDRASAFERAGGRIIELPKSEWRQIAEAKPVVEEKLAA